MKTKIYTLLIMIAMLLPAITLRAEVVTGTSEPFAFGDATAVPLSPLPVVISVLLIGIFLFWRYYKTKKQAA